MPYMVTPTSWRCVLESVSWTEPTWDISLLFSFYVFDHQNFFHHSILIKLVSPFGGACDGRQWQTGVGLVKIHLGSRANNRTGILDREAKFKGYQ